MSEVSSKPFYCVYAEVCSTGMANSDFSIIVYTTSVFQDSAKFWVSLRKLENEQHREQGHGEEVHRIEVSNSLIVASIVLKLRESKDPTKDFLTQIAPVYIR